MRQESIDIIDQQYSSLSIEEKQRVYNAYFSNDDSVADLKKNLQLLIFKEVPPTGEEFLDPRNKWLPQKVVDSIYPHVREDFLSIVDGGKDYFQLCFYGATRLGKCEGIDTPILMYDLSVKKIQDIKIGDLLMGEDSTPREVLKTHTGFGKLYKVKQNKGDDYVVNENHILTLQYTNKGDRKDRNNSPDKDNGKIIDISVQDYLKLSKSEKHRLKGIKAKLEFAYQEIDIDPYFLGLWLADGCKYHTSITSIDQEIIDYIYDYAKFLNLNILIENKNYSDKTNSYRICGTTKGNQFKKNDNTLYYHLKDTYNLLHNKHIPKQYIQNTKEIRLQVLAGLIDGDGHKVKNSNVYCITQKNKKLADDIVFLARSLGFRANISQVEKKCYNNGEINTYFNINISGDLRQVPCKLKRKQSNTPCRIDPLRTRITVEECEEGEFFGFELDGTHRYLHADLTITHNTFLARLIIIYTIIFIHHLREPSLFYNLSPLTDLCLYFISWKFSKTRQLYLKPMFKILESSERFMQVIYQDKVPTEQKKYGCKKIVYSKASSVGEITLASGLQIILGNDDPNEILGADILQVYISEIAFFIEAAGASEEEIFRLYTDAYDRISATVGKDYLAFIYLDSSANYADSLIENHIINELQFDKDTYFKWRSRWQARPYKFPKWQETGETFTVITGNGSIPASLVTHPAQLDNIPPDLIDYPPIDVKKQYEQNLLKSIKDISGKPTSNESKFIQNKTFIDNIFDNSLLRNVLVNIKADAEEIPEKLIFNQIESEFFLRNIDNSLLFYRAPRENRYIGLDLSFSLSGDATGISMIHKEYSTELKSVIYVTDFSFAILPKTKSINLDAIVQFIYELRYIAGINIKGVYVDTFQSEMVKQNLERKDIKVTKQSVDQYLEPYQFILTLLANNMLKAGKNIYLKNNLFCLQRVKNEKNKEKVDHPKGIVMHDYDGNWKTSLVGVNAKDVSDSLCQAVWGAKNDDSYIPFTNYEMENKRYSGDIVIEQDLIKQAIRKVMYF